MSQEWGAHDEILKRDHRAISLARSLCHAKTPQAAGLCGLGSASFRRDSQVGCDDGGQNPPLLAVLSERGSGPATEHVILASRVPACEQPVPCCPFGRGSPCALFFSGSTLPSLVQSAVTG